MKISEGGDNITPMRAVLIRHSRLKFADGGLIEVKLWGVPVSPDKPHGYKYSLVYIAEGRRVIGTIMQNGGAIIGMTGTGRNLIGLPPLTSW